MVGPFMQGVLLMGIIYWYSKGLISLINDYYRVEFNRKLKTEINEQKIEDFKSQTYDLNDMEQLINIEVNKEKFTSAETVSATNNDESNFHLKSASSKKICYRRNGKEEFLKIILFAINYNRLEEAMCWTKEKQTVYFPP